MPFSFFSFFSFLAFPILSFPWPGPCPCRLCCPCSEPCRPSCPCQTSCSPCPSSCCSCSSCSSSAWSSPHLPPPLHPSSFLYRLSSFPTEPSSARPSFSFSLQTSPCSSFLPFCSCSSSSCPSLSSPSFPSWPFPFYPPLRFPSPSPSPPRPPC